MKKLFVILILVSFIGASNFINAQGPNSNFEQKIFTKRIIKETLSNTDTIPGFNLMENKLKITGTIFKPDGTPAKDVTLYIYQADEDGKYNVLTQNSKKTVHHKALIKTDSDGIYTFYTFIPGAAIDLFSYPKKRSLKEIIPGVIKDNNQEDDLYAFVFDNDPALTKSCRNRLKRKGIDTILTLEKEGELFIAKKDIVLE